MITRDELMGLLSALDLVIVDLYELADDQDHPAPYGVLHLDDLSAAAWNAIGGMPVPHLPVGTIVEVVDTIITPDQGELIEANSGPGGDERLGRVEYSADDGMVIRFEDGPDMQVRSFGEWAQLRPALLWESGGGPLADADERENLGTAHPLAHRAQLGVPLVPNPLTDRQHLGLYERAEGLADRAQAISEAWPPGHTGKAGWAAEGDLMEGAMFAHGQAMQSREWPEKARHRHAGYGFQEQRLGIGMPTPNPVKDDGKWHKLDGGGYQIRMRGPYGSFANALAYHPRKDPRTAEYASAYELTTGQKIPKGTKWVVLSVVETPGGSNRPQYSAHRTLAAAKRAGSAAINRRSNPWPAIPEGAFATSYNPPPSPFAGRNFPEGALATSYNPPPSPFGRPTYSSGMLQGQSVQRTNARQPLSLSDWDDCE